MTAEEIMHAAEEFSRAVLVGRRVALERAAAHLQELDAMYPGFSRCLQADPSPFDLYVQVSREHPEGAFDVDLPAPSVSAKPGSSYWVVRVRRGSQEGELVYERHCPDPVAQLAAMAEWVAEGRRLEGWMG